MIASVNLSGEYDSRIFSQLVSLWIMKMPVKVFFIPIIHLEMIIIFSHERSH